MIIGFVLGLSIGVSFGLLVGAVLAIEHNREADYELRRDEHEVAENGDWGDGREFERGIGGYDLRRGSHVREQ